MGTIFIAEERVDLSKYPPACLPKHGEEFPSGTQAFVYGGQIKKYFHLLVIW